MGAGIRGPTLQVEFTRLVAEARGPARAHADDAGFDLFACEGVRLGPGDRASVGTGFAVAIPPGHGGLVLPRSGLAAHHGIALVNSPGLIDPGYRGEVRVLMLNTDRHHAFAIRPGDRVAQLVVVRLAAATFVEATELGETVRGAAGFGSTGIEGRAGG